MMVVGLPTFIVDERGVIKRQEIQTWDKNPKTKAYVDEIMMPKDVFIECYNKWINNNCTGIEKPRDDNTCKGCIHNMGNLPDTEDIYCEYIEDYINNTRCEYYEENNNNG